MRRRRAILVAVALLAMLGAAGWYYRNRADSQVTNGPPLVFEDAPPNLDALPRERRKIEAGEFDGWRWVKLGLNEKPIAIAIAGQKPLAFVQTETGAVHLVAFDRAESLALQPAVPERRWLRAGVACTPSGGAYAYSLAPRDALDYWDVFRGRRSLNDSHGLHVGGVVQVSSFSASSIPVGFIPFQFNSATIVFSPDGTSVAAGVCLPMFSQGWGHYIASTVSIWNLKEAANWQTPAALAGGEGLAEIRWESGPARDTMRVESLAWSLDGALLAAAGGADTEGYLRRPYVRDEAGHILDFSERHRRFEAAWDAMTSEQRGKAAEMARNTGLLACMWDAQTGRLLREWRGEPGERVWPLAMAPQADGRLLMVGQASRELENGYRFELMSFDRAKEKPTRRRLSSDPPSAVFVGSDAALLVVLKGVASIQDSLAGKIESSFDLRARFGHEEGWAAAASADVKAVALWNQSGVILYRTRP